MIQVIVNGLLIGAVYSLIAVGLTMIHGVMKIVNFAQGELLMVGMYTTYVLYGILMPEGSAPYLLIVPVCIIMFLFGTIVFKATVSHVIGKSETSYIILTIGISYLLRYGFQMIFGSNYQSIHVSESLKFGSVALGGIVFTTTRLIAFFAALICTVLVHYLLSSTDIGRAMRATSENKTVATSLGVNTKIVYIVAFGLGTVFAGVSGLLVTPLYMIYPSVGAVFSTIAMSAMVLGGLGNIRGAMIGGLIIGVVEALSSTYLTTNVSQIFINLVLILILIFKPYGLFGKGARVA